ncbi:BsaA family SipW-dependent biofilm matrix protein [Hespellia stercorisuis]|uniref:Alternate signal-mediated exported protein, CPF_0494 family n=1 Tax=Hespellia stercorisuis DSM 15480 TaxID=1121950 RepID=A0A1M6I909_9FIRM|nr:BsaA family SipW-dependent biofilm matrix protein [Hespellia stercorisuis]SHJ30917.1 alternate signal-mediated exported protein, CPF_0494 family [Hespellia stercorisuis DSM 15480]
MNKRRKHIGAILGLSALLVIGTTFAVWYQRVQHTNHLVADTIRAEVTENYTPGEPENTVTKEVSFKNAGTTDVFVRAANIETWEKKDSSDEHMILSNKLDGQDVAVKNWTEVFSADWQDGGDGWFYYKHILKAGESTQDILSSVTFPDYTQPVYQEYEDADYSLYFKVEMLQASTGDATLNKDTVNEEASQTVFGKSLFVDYDSSTVTWQ